MNAFTSKNLSVATLAATLLASSASPGAVIPFSPLPKSDAAMRVPGSAPTHVNGSEHVKGIFIARAPIQRGAPNYKRLGIVESAKDAAAFAANGYVPGADTRTAQRCVFVTDEMVTSGDNWPAFARGEVNFFPAPSQNPVVGIHVETLDDGSTSGRSPTLGITDAWLDSRTGGLKWADNATIPLAVIAEGPYGIRVLGARSEDSVHFVVLPSVSETDEGSTPQFDRATIEIGGEVGDSQCRYSRITLAARPGSGEHAVVTFQHVVRAERDPADPKSAESPKFSDFATTRTRLVQVHLSASHNASAPEPVVSVSFRLDKPKPFGA